jgi:hypothetical protein
VRLVHNAMRTKISLFSLSCLILLTVICSFDLDAAQAVSLVGEKTLVLYDADSGSIPDSSLIGFTAFPPDGASRGFEDGGTVLDTTLAGTDTYAGWVAGAATTDGFPILDSGLGFQVNFTLQIESEIHESNNRSGFSILLLDQNAKGIEMSFWQNEIWVQNDDSTGGLFTHGEGIVFATTAGVIEYELRFSGDQYTLTANAQPLLSGSLRDYSPFEGFPDPYETPNFMFLGDDTTSAQARIRLRFLSVTGTEPVLPTSTVTSASTNLPQPTGTAPALPSTTPFPTPVSANPVVDLCPSGWLLTVVMIGHVTIIAKSRRTKNNSFLR